MSPETVSLNLEIRMIFGSSPFNHLHTTGWFDYKINGRCEFKGSYYTSLNINARR